MRYVFLPGTLCDERLWENQISALPGGTQGFCVNLRTQRSLQEMFASIESVPFPEFVLIGFSMGGYVAQEFTLRFPERVAQLVLIGSSGRGYTPAEYELAKKTRKLAESGMFKGISPQRLAKFLHPKAFADEALRNLIQDMAGKDASRVYANQLSATLERRDLRRELASLSCPATLIGGKDDQIVPAEWIAELGQIIPRSQVHLLEECGHFAPLEQPGQVSRILNGLH